MNKNIYSVVVLLVGNCMAQSSFGAALSDNGAKYHAAGEIKIGGQGGWDDLSVDSVSHRLFVSHSDRVVVIDTESQKVIAEIPDTPGVHGIAVASDFNKAFSSDGKENMVGVIDLKSLKLLRKIKVGDNPDAIVYDAGQHEIYVFNGRSKSVSIINAQTDKVANTLSLPGKPEFAAVDYLNHRVYVNIEDKNLIVALDTTNHQIASQFPIAGCESPSGLAFDEEGQKIFSVCENEKMVMVDARSGHVLSSITSGLGADGAAYDPILRLAFSSNGKSGTVTIARTDSAGQLVKVADLKTQLGARTMTLDKITHRIYLPTASFNPAVAGKRPQPIEGTQKVLVFEP